MYQEFPKVMIFYFLELVTLTEHYPTFYLDLLLWLVLQRLTAEFYTSSR